MDADAGDLIQSYLAVKFAARMRLKSPCAIAEIFGESIGESADGLVTIHLMARAYPFKA